MLADRSFGGPHSGWMFAKNSFMKCDGPLNLNARVFRPRNSIPGNSALGCDSRAIREEQEAEESDDKKALSTIRFALACCVRIFGNDPIHHFQFFFSEQHFIGFVKIASLFYQPDQIRILFKVFFIHPGDLLQNLRSR